MRKRFYGLYLLIGFLLMGGGASVQAWVPSQHKSLSVLLDGSLSGVITGSAGGNGATSAYSPGSRVVGEVSFDAEADFEQRYQRTYHEYVAGELSQGRTSVTDVGSLIDPQPVYRTLADMGGTPPPSWVFSTLPLANESPDAIAGGTVEARNPSTGSIVGTATIQANGSYTITGLPPGQYAVRASASGYVSEYLNDYYALAVAVRITVISGINIPNINITLAPAGTVNGRVTAANGVTPLANSEVYWTASNYESPIRCTDANGLYTLPDAPTNNTFRVYASGRTCNSSSQPYVGEYWQETTTYKEASPIFFTSASTTRNNINFTLNTGGRISGNIYREDGVTPLAYPFVSFYDSAGLYVGGMSSNGVNGSYVSILLKPDNYYVQVNAAAPAPTSKYYPNANSIATATLVAVTTGVTTPNINITLPLPLPSNTGAITGTVYAPDGVTPVTDALVYLWYPNANGVFNAAFGNYVNAVTGQFNFSGLAPASYKIEIRSSSYVAEFYPDKTTLGTAAAIVVGAATITNINPVLNSGITVTGTIFDRNTGYPIQTGIVVVYTPSGDYVTFTTTGVAGTYKVTVPSGIYTIYAHRFGIGAGRWLGDVIQRVNASTFTVAGDGMLPNMNVTLGRFGEVIGNVTQTNGLTPIPNASVRVTQIGSPFSPVYCANSRSVFVHEQVIIGVDNIVNAFVNPSACGSSLSSNFAPEYWQQAPTVVGATMVVPTNADRVVEGINFTLGAGGSISGTIFQADGTTPLPNAVVAATITEYETVNLLTVVQANASGQYQIIGLGTASYFLEASASGYVDEYYQNQTLIENANAVAVTAGANTPNINFTLITKSNSATVSGTYTMLGLPSKPHASWVMGVDVTITPTGGGATVFNNRVTTNQNGLFVIESLPPGTYTLVIRRFNALPLTKTNVVLIVGNNPVDMGSAKGGDADGNNLINITDFSILATSFGKSTGQVGFDARADFNNDGIVNISDFSMLATYFGQSG